MKTLIPFILVLVFATGLSAQGEPDSVYERRAVEHLMALLNLKLSDFSFREDYTKIDSFRLRTISDLMRNTYGMIEFADRLGDNCRGGDLAEALKFMFDNLKKSQQVGRGRPDEPYAVLIETTGMNLYYNTLEFNRLLSKVHACFNELIIPAQKETFSGLSDRQMEFLVNEFREIILEDTADASRPVDEIDSLAKVEEEYLKEFVEFGTGIKKDRLLDAGMIAAVEILSEIDILFAEIESGEITISRILSDTAAIPRRTGIASYLGKAPGWKIGGTGNDYHKGDYYFIIDFGGDDRYDLSYDPYNPHPVVIIDLSGDDVYNAVTDFAIGSGCLSVGLLYDIEGDDTYNGGNFSCGSGYFGFGMLYDKSGYDTYRGDTHCQGAASFGIGLVMDMDGPDLYSAALFSQGFGLTEGFGMIADYGGADYYLSGNKYKENLGLAGDDARFLSLSQGFGYGLRPYLSGGIGAIADFEGNDIYISDIYGQASSYWWALGILYDERGMDRYLSHQYAQGAGIHMSLGILADQAGDDFYRGHGLMQGCGHDYGCGMALDRGGDDIYQSRGLSQGGGQANGFGVLINDRGDDAYFVIDTHNTQGYGNPRRDFGSIGLFIDMAGKDLYAGNGSDNSYWKTRSKWGGGMDWEFITPDSAVVEDNDSHEE